MRAGIDPLDAAATKRSKVKVADLGGMLSRATLDGAENDKPAVAAPVDRLPATDEFESATHVPTAAAAAGPSLAAMASFAGARNGSPVRRKGTVTCYRHVHGGFSSD
jgi:hypothetical protein